MAGSQAEQHGILASWQITSINGQPFEERPEYLRDCRLGKKPFTLTVASCPIATLEDFGIVRRRDARLHLPPEWVEVIKRAYEGLSYYRNDETGQCCEGVPLPQAKYPRNEDPARRWHRISALKMLASAAPRSLHSRRRTLISLLRDFAHDLHEATRMWAIGVLACLRGDPDALHALASRRSDDSRNVTATLVDVLEHWLKHDSGCREALRLLGQHREAVRDRAEQYPNGLAIRIDMPGFLRGLRGQLDEADLSD